MKTNLAIIILLLLSYNTEDVNLNDLETEDSDHKSKLIKLVKNNLNPDNKINRILLRKLFANVYIDYDVKELLKLKAKNNLNKNQAFQLDIFNRISHYLTDHFNDMEIDFEEFKKQIQDFDFHKYISQKVIEETNKYKNQYKDYYDMKRQEIIDKVVDEKKRKAEQQADL